MKNPTLYRLSAVRSSAPWFSRPEKRSAGRLRHVAIRPASIVAEVRGSVGRGVLVFASLSAGALFVLAFA